ncbi:unnamed protein product [Adineta steineri]|uniref:Uncharacterized protein n=1 Tax=Adineta steineri TaxID=433720 RepID=A0A815AHL7_9BILA|nr:unnamed protein product [Adineta steineri]CAF3869938.1 unnamed protein product [Adineta steineri]
MRASSNNYHQYPLPFATDVVEIHSNKLSEDDTGYDSLPKQSRMSSTAGISLKSMLNMINNIPSSTDISTANDIIDKPLLVKTRIAQFSQQTQSITTTLPHRTRVKPIPDSTSDSADSIPLSNHVEFVSSYQQQIPIIDIPPFGGNLEYIHDNRFDSTTTVDNVKNDVIAIELMEQQQRINQLVDPLCSSKQHLSWIERLGESIRLLPANVLAIVFIGLIGGLIVSVILVIIIA